MIATMIFSVSTAAATTGEDEEGETGLYISANIYGASVYVDGLHKGITPLTITGMTPGKHRLEITKVHYATDLSYVMVEENVIKEVTCDLQKISGKLTVISNPEGAAVYCDGNITTSKGIELDEGEHSVLAKKFGYEEKTDSVNIVRGREYTLAMNMKKADFKLLSFDSEKTLFNPKDYGYNGSIEFNVSVTAPETGRLEITSSEGETVYTKEISFTSWDQKEKWTGRDEDNYIVEDGLYTATMTAAGQSFSYSFTVDSNIVRPMLTQSQSGLGLGSVASARLYPKHSNLLTVESGASFTSGSDVFYGVPITASIARSFTKNIEISGTFTGLVKDGFNYGFNVTAKYASSYPLAKETLFYGVFVRLGGSSAASFSPYGIDVGCGLGGGIILGYLIDDIYIGAESTVLYKPVTGPFSSSGNDVLWKNGLMVQKCFDTVGMGIYASFASGFGTYESGDGLETVDLESPLKSGDFGGRFAFYVAGLPLAVGLQGGVMIVSAEGSQSIFSDTSSFYPYAKLNVTWMF